MEVAVTGAVQRRPRADGQRNRARILEVALRLFVERGAEVPFTEIAKEAGVGVGTVYRHFPAREDLIEAAYRSELDAVCAAAGELIEAMPPADALRTWMDRFIDYWATKIGLTDAIRAVVAAGGDPFAQSRERLDDAVGALLSATAAAGFTRPEVKADDLVVSLSGIAMVVGVLEDREQVGRMLDLLYEGMRTRP
ncbi:TetR/AcrR family transcriptional regulator [Streptomyces spinoverrucosus]|uniref:TetR/AcrR family transcriptional regulator n=1 Tax=Streptomyces spinoverrucosus TaxID=284043 RepID=UPI0027D9F653|nr:helix-turn-helix domain-containing protein [Streptomyces spinoverrucosus]